jgi:hypothetical protein
MSDPTVAAVGQEPPISADFLPPNLRKHVDPKAPVPLRMMAAKGLVPLGPSDMVGALFLLTYDADEKVREAAQKTAAGLPDKILGVALRDESVKAPALGYFLRVLAGKDVYEEMLILNASTPDDAVAWVAKTCSGRTAEIIGQNQLRILRHEDIIRQLCQNPAAPISLIDSVCDFAVRSGVSLPDVPQMKDARVRLFGPEVETAPPVEEGPTAEQMLQEFTELADEAAAPIEDTKRLNLTQRVMKMNIAQKIKLATLGNKEARSILARDSNKLVAVAVIRSPRITDGEVLLMANNRAVQDEVLRIIYQSREWTRSYPIKLALVKNPKVPLSITMRFLGTLREAEVKDLSRNKNVPSGIQQLAKKMLDKKSSQRGGGGGH